MYCGLSTVIHVWEFEKLTSNIIYLQLLYKIHNVNNSKYKNINIIHLSVYFSSTKNHILSNSLSHLNPIISEVVFFLKKYER